MIEKNMGNDRVHDIIEIIDIYPITKKIIDVLYRNRTGYTIKQLSKIVSSDYQKIHRCISRLIKKGFVVVLKEREGKVILTQLSLDFYPTFSKLDINKEFTKIFRRKSVIKLLLALEKMEMSWKNICSDLRLSSSSQKMVLDFLISGKLVKKEGKIYNITNKGLDLLNKYKNISDIELIPRYEMQLKVAVDNNFSDICKEVKKKLKGNLISIKRVRQEDHYIVPHYHEFNPNEYFRYRIERPRDIQLTNPLKCEISWSRKVDSILKDRLQILERQKETLPAAYPSILFFLEYLDGREKLKIIKERLVLKTNDEIQVNIDNILYPQKMVFIEIKKALWDFGKKEKEIGKIKRIFSDLGISFSNHVPSTYLEFFSEME